MPIEGRTTDTGSDAVNASFDTLAQTNNALNRRVTDLETETHAGESREVGQPRPGSPFIIKQDPQIKGMQVTCAIDFPPATSIDLIRLIYRNTLETPADNREQEWKDVLDSEAQNGHFEGTFSKLFDYGETFVVAAIIIKGVFPTAGKERNPNPPDDSVTLVSFTIDQQFGAPSAPSLGSIIENKTDDTTKAFDAFIVVQVIAPADSSTPASGTAAVTNNSTTIVGTGTSYLSQVAIGRGVTVNGETHIVTAVPDNTHITVDFPFKQTISGQVLTVSVLKTWGQIDGIKRVVSKFRLSDDANSRPVTKGHEITSDDLALSSVSYRVNGLVAARKYIWRHNVIVSTVSKRDVSSSGTVTFIAGGFTDATANIPEITGPAFQYDVTEPFNDKERNTSIVFTQPNPPVALDHAECRLFKKLTGTVSLTISGSVMNGAGTLFLTELAAGYLIVVGSQTLQIANVPNNTTANLTTSSGASVSGQTCYANSNNIHHEVNLRRARFHPPTGGQIPPIVWGNVKTKKLLQHLLRIDVFAQNGTFRHIDDNFTTGSTGEIDGDSAAPGAPPAPDLQEWFGSLKCEADLPSTNVNTFKKFRYVMSTSPSAPSSVTSPSVGVDGVLRIKKSPGAVEFQRKTADISSTTFYFYVQALNQIDWGPWSAATSILGSTISRPLSDVIGNGVPTLGMGLERSTTAPGSPAIANDATHYSIDTGASAVTDFYVGMHLHIPSIGVTDRIRKITAYDATNHRLTVDVAFGATPGNSLAFEIHRGAELGEKSGTSLSTTQMRLGTAGAALADNTLVGFAVFLPTLANETRFTYSLPVIRRITAHASGIITFDSALAGTLPTNEVYMICKGSFGFASINPTSGICAPVPLRIWYNADNPTAVTNRVEVIVPSGENAFSQTDGQIQGRRASNGKVRDDFKFEPNGSPSFDRPVVSAQFLWRVRVRNMYRDGGSDGWSAYSFNVEGYPSTATPALSYDPDTFIPIDIDFNGFGSYPISRYPVN